MFFKSHLLESDFISPVTTWARARRGVGQFQCRMSVILEEESRNWGPHPGFASDFYEKPRFTLPVRKARGELEGSVLCRALRPAFLLGSGCGTLGLSFPLDGFQPPGLTTSELS